ncbi:MAG: DUF4432 family protein [Alphaproteobacteria bacterium]|nr:DUF4432 family protein [Alphaproteobacteria bacterium]
MTMTLRIELTDNMFGEKERQLLTMGALRVSTFRYDNGIAALRVANARGELIILPFKGHQIWRCSFDGRELAMKSMFDEPVDTRSYLETYGAFFIHCGLTGMGAPGPEDRHPLHGELPNAPFQRAYLDCDETAKTLTVGGVYHYTVAFTVNYRATSTYKIHEAETLFDAKLDVENLMQIPMDLMYLAHANFRPVDGGELLYTAKKSPETVRVRQSIPGHITPKPGYREFIADLAKDPSLHHMLKAGQGYDPEIVFYIDMESDKEGYAHAMLKRPDGFADYIRYKPSEVRKCVRWISRTGDQDAIGMAFPATSEPEGYKAEKAKGNVVTLDPKGHWSVSMRLGSLTKAEVESVARAIASL